MQGHGSQVRTGVWSIEHGAKIGLPIMFLLATESFAWMEKQERKFGVFGGVGMCKEGASIPVSML